MPSVTNIKSISYLKSHASQISQDLELNGNPFFITQNGDAKRKRGVKLVPLFFNRATLEFARNNRP